MILPMFSEKCFNLSLALVVLSISSSLSKRRRTEGSVLYSFHFRVMRRYNRLPTNVVNAATPSFSKCSHILTALAYSTSRCLMSVRPDALRKPCFSFLLFFFSGMLYCLCLCSYPLTFYVFSHFETLS